MTRLCKECNKNDAQPGTTICWDCQMYLRWLKKQERTKGIRKRQRQRAGLSAGPA